MIARKDQYVRASLCLLMGAFLLAAASGCRTTKPPIPVYTEGSAPDVSVKLEAGDLVEIKFFYAPELNETQRVRPDGKIALQLVGEVAAQGKEPGQLQAELKKMYEGVIEKPEVSVLVREMNNRAVFVGGSVKIPGRIAMPGSLTALGAIMHAGGFDMAQAGYHKVMVIRTEENQTKAYLLDFSDELNGSPDKPFYLHAQDIVFVPRTKITDVNQWIDQYLNRIVPQFGFIYSAPLGNGTIGIDTSRR